MERTRLSSIVEESENRNVESSNRSRNEALRGERLADDLVSPRSRSEYFAITPRLRRSRSLGRFLRSAFCGSCRSIKKNFSNTSLDIPPYRGATKAVKTQPEASSKDLLVRATSHVGTMLIAESLEQAKSNRDSAERDPQRGQKFGELDRELNYERISRRDIPGPSTGAVPKKRSRSVPSRPQECTFCEDVCAQGRIVVDASLFPQQSVKPCSEVLIDDFKKLILELPTPLFKKGTCPACCGDCRAEAAGQPINEETKACCCGFEKAKCWLANLTLPSAEAEVGATPKSAPSPAMKEKKFVLHNETENVEIKRPPSTPESTGSSVFNFKMSPLASGLKYERVRCTPYGKAFSVSPKQRQEKIDAEQYKNLVDSIMAVKAEERDSAACEEDDENFELRTAF